MASSSHLSRLTSPAETLHEMARRLGQLRPDWRNPEAFFEERSELQHAMRQHARRLERSYG